MNGKYDYEIKDGNQMLDEFYDDSALTIAGCLADREGMNCYVDTLSKYADLKDSFAIYTVSGKAMNERYELTGNNRYRDDLSFVVVMLSDLMVKDTKFYLDRFGWGGRWFDDIVDNNANRENRQ